MALILENVGKTFENTGRATLKNINLEIQPGEFLCVVGKSGCGKSTLLNLIAGLEAPTEGRILLNGKEVKYLVGNAPRRGKIPSRRFDRIFEKFNFWQQKLYDIVPIK